MSFLGDGVSGVGYWGVGYLGGRVSGEGVGYLGVWYPGEGGYPGGTETTKAVGTRAFLF